MEQQFTAHKRVIQQQIATRFAELEFADSSYEAYLDYRIRQVVDSFQVYFLETETVESEEIGMTVRFPLTWWDAFKARWFPNWLLKRCPVKENEVPVSINKTVRRCCPHIATPSRSIHFDFLANVERKVR